MIVTLDTYTMANPQLAFQKECDANVILLNDGNRRFPHNLVEYAGRVCYRSTARQGRAGSFILDRVREGHEDIIEHVWASVIVTWGEDEEVDNFDLPHEWPLHSNHLYVEDCSMSTRTHIWIVSANVRAWLQLYREEMALMTLPVVRSVLPDVFAELPGEAAPLPKCTDPIGSERWGAPRRTANGALVLLLGWTRPPIMPHSPPYGSAVFLLEGISRACSHQLVRHRLGSFSQESQRYVDLSKGGWQAVIPPSFRDNMEIMHEMENLWDSIEDRYRLFRELGATKEDARFLLPNACETRMVMSMPIEGWRHFCELRAVDRAAQWEIREVGVEILRILGWLCPERFGDLVLKLNEQETA